MKIGDIFVKDINRRMNPVIKVNDMEDSALDQELEEYVVTKDIDGNFEKLYKGIAKCLGGGGDKDHIGVWISGDFGSGKSHYLKISSALLQNREIQGKRAVDYFLNKPGLSEPVLRMMQDLGRRTIDTILFDIDSKSKRSQSEDSLVQVFMGVFNEKQGLCFEHSVATFERFLVEKGLYDGFRSEFTRCTGKTWEGERTKTAFLKGKIADALMGCGAYSDRAEAEDVASRVSKELPLSVDEFADIVGRYCESKGPGYTLFFMADEVGQFISGNVQRMLKLQTITERIGVRCKGQAWIIVTSQEDVDAVVSGVSSNDFSKIQGRFTTRIKMTSSDVKEVVEKRVLLKKDSAADELGAFYVAHRTDIQNKLGMKNAAEIRLYSGTEEFVNTYPFIPYQYPMLQDMLTSLRNKSASGKSLSYAARSMLKVFKETAASNAEKDTSFVTPLYAFYDAIQPELDSPTNNVFHNASECTTLNGFDIDVLKTLFLVKYYDRLEKSLDNISALMITSFDQNRLDLKGKVQESLTRLVKENYVQANADTYIFLTNEEQEISREIRNESVDPGSVYRDIANAAFGTIFKLTSGKLNGRQFNRYVEEDNINHTDHELSVRILTTDKVPEPYLPAKSENSILFKIPDGKKVENAFMDYLRTEQYIRKKEGTQQTASMRSILEGKRAEITEMRQYANSLLDTALREARVFVNGQESQISNALTAEKRFSDATESLIGSVYLKNNYVRQKKPSSVIEAFLKNGSTPLYEEIVIGMENAFAEVQTYLEDRKATNTTTTVKDVMDHFRRKPYGFDTEDIQWMLSIMFRCNRIDLVYEGRTLKGLGCGFPDAKNCLLTSKNHDKVKIDLRQAVTQDLIAHAAEVLSTLFSKTVMRNEANVVGESNRYASEKLQEIGSKLEIYRDNPRYPGREILREAEECMGKLSKLGSPEIFDYINENGDRLLELKTEMESVYDFLEPGNPRRNLFDKGLAAERMCSDIEAYLDDETKEGVKAIGEILDSHDSKRLPQLNPLCERVTASVERITDQVREEKVSEVMVFLKDNETVFTEHPDLHQEFRDRCNNIIQSIEGSDSISTMAIAVGSLTTIRDKLIQRIPKVGPQPSPGTPGVTVPPATSPPTPKRMSVMISTIYSDSKTIASEEDIERMIVELRERMVRRLADGPFDIVW